MGSSIYQMSTRSKPCWSKISTLCFLFTFFSFVPSLLTSQIPVITSDQSNAITPLSPSSPSYQSTTLGSNSALFAVETAESPKNSANVLLAPSSYTQSSECALILQRTYVVNLPSESTRSPLFAGFLSVIKQPAQFTPVPTGKQEELCIRYVDVETAIQEAKYRRNYIRPNGLNSLEPLPPIISQTAELALEVTRVLATQFKLSPDEILNGLPLIDLSRTTLWEECPAHVKPIPCTIERYRTFTGHCNNLKTPSWGVTFTPFVRYLPPVYSNGIDGYRVSVVDGSPLPSARMVTATVHRDVDRPDSDLTILIMSWGQFIDHDLTLAAPPRDENDLEFDCCELRERGTDHPLCAPIIIPDDDPLYSPFGKRCHDFKRSVAGHRPNCALGPRAHINTLSSPIDANFIYGSSDALARRLRAFKGGLMKVWDRFNAYGLKPLLPPESDNPERDCTARPRHLFCFIAGDERVNEQIHLTVLHTLYVRDHNRIATALAELNPHWDDEKLFQEARHIMAASVQHITLNEFLPLLLGTEMVEKYNITVQAEGYRDDYDANVHIGPSHAFQTAAFRFGHTFIQGMVRRYDKFHQFLGEDPLHNLLRQPFIVYEPGKMDELIGGLINTPAQTYDPFITQEVSGRLFQPPHKPFGLDLAAINLERGREHGLPGYNAWREWCGLGRAQSWQDLVPVLQNNTAYLYSQIYKHPDDIDLWSGGISEVRLPGAMIGPTFACIIAQQFSNIRRGDRFWYDRSGLPSSFTPEQLYEIKKSVQSKIICENADDIPTIQTWVMRQAHPIFNPRVACSDLPSIDLRYWQEDPNTGALLYRRK
ncbi:peroxidase [Tetranychus urticae]|uniref:Chorion peroxidase n=1 Tax=Tetranychus urticae TaxID=32264 RepID=T1K8X5_TETUR|nr:peroxidase [Tetranychus urticae]